VSAPRVEKKKGKREKKKKENRKEKEEKIKLTFPSTSVLPFVQKIFFGTATTKDYTSTGSYGAPMASAFPWSTAAPPKAA